MGTKMNPFIKDEYIHFNLCISCKSSPTQSFAKFYSFILFKSQREIYSIPLFWWLLMGLYNIQPALINTFITFTFVTIFYLFQSTLYTAASWSFHKTNLPLVFSAWAALIVSFNFLDGIHILYRYMQASSGVDSHARLQIPFSPSLHSHLFCPYWATWSFSNASFCLSSLCQGSKAQIHFEVKHKYT